MIFSPVLALCLPKWATHRRVSSKNHLIGSSNVIHRHGTSWMARIFALKCVQMSTQTICLPSIMNLVTFSTSCSTRICHYRCEMEPMLDSMKQLVVLSHCQPQRHNICWKYVRCKTWFRFKFQCAIFSYPSFADWIARWIQRLARR